MIKNFIAMMFIVMSTHAIAQQANYDVTAGNGNGLRFWSGNDSFKIHMGVGTEYQYGPVTDYSIKMNMNNDATRGWTWGVYGQTPIAALSTTGKFSIAGTFETAGNISLPNASGAKYLYTWSNGDNNWRIGMNNSPGFTRSIATSHVQYATYSTGAGQGFALGVNGGESSFEVQGSNHQAFFRGNVGVGQANPYSQSRLHIKSPSATPWGLITEASGNGKIIGLGHDGTTGYISTSYLDASGYSPLSLQTSNTNRLFIAVDGKVGIGTNAPQNNFEVLGSGQILRNTIASDYTSLRLYNNQNNLMRALEIDYSGSSYGGTLLNSGPTGESASIGTTGAYPLVFGTSNTARMTITSGGNVGVGTYSPDEKLTVKGKIHTEEVRVDLSVPGPDYVFEKDYDLQSLEEIKQYIEANKHLSEVPSAKEMEEKGINVGEMNMILLKKIEELTLHLIELKEQNDELSKKYELLIQKK